LCPPPDARRWWACIRIVVFGFDDNDDIAIATNVNYFAHVHRGNGDDRMTGHPDDDILVAGSTIYDDEGIAFTNQINAVDLMREWNRNAGNTMPGMTAQDDYNERVIHITTEGGAGGNNAFSWLNDGSTGTQTVFDDGAEDKVTGASGFDLFFFNGDQDKAADLNGEEFAFDMEFLTQA